MPATDIPHQIRVVVFLFGMCTSSYIRASLSDFPKGCASTVGGHAHKAGLGMQHAGASGSIGTAFSNVVPCAESMPSMCHKRRICPLQSVRVSVSDIGA